MGRRPCIYVGARPVVVLDTPRAVDSGKIQIHSEICFKFALRWSHCRALEGVWLRHFWMEIADALKLDIMMIEPNQKQPTPGNKNRQLVRESFVGSRSVLRDRDMQIYRPTMEPVPSDTETINQPEGVGVMKR